MALHVLNDRFVGTHRVNAVADDRNNAIVAAFERVGHLLGECRLVVGQGRSLGDQKLDQFVGVDTESKRSAAAQIKPKAEFTLLNHHLFAGAVLLHHIEKRIADIKRDSGNKQKRQPLPHIVTNNIFLGHICYLSLSFEKLTANYTKISVRSPAARQYGPNSQNHRPLSALTSNFNEI